MNMQLKVKPEVLISKSNELSGEKNKVLGTMDQMKTEINSLAAAWRSEGADEYQNRFRRVYSDIDQIMQTLSVYITDLNEAANLYSNAENTVKTSNEGLPAGSVFKV